MATVPTRAPVSQPLAASTTPLLRGLLSHLGQNLTQAEWSRTRSRACQFASREIVVARLARQLTNTVGRGTTATTTSRWKR